MFVQANPRKLKLKRVGEYVDEQILSKNFRRNFVY